MIIKVMPDKEKVKSILKMIEDREKFISESDINKFYTIIAENYYEVIKELITSLILLDGFKAIGENAHKDLIDYLSNYKEFSEDEILLINDLRIKRNKSSYEGKHVDKSYIPNKKDKLLGVINKLKALVKTKLK